MFGRYSHVRHRSWRDRLSPEIAWPEYDWRAVPIPIDQRNAVISDTYHDQPDDDQRDSAWDTTAGVGPSSPSTIGQDWAKQLGIPNVSPRDFPQFPGLQQPIELHRRNDFLPAGQQWSSASQEVGEDFTFQENLTKVLNRHTLKFGYEMIRTRYNSLVPALPSGTYRFGGTDFPFRPNTGSCVRGISPRLGQQCGVHPVPVTTWLPRWWSHAFYVQDDFKLFRNSR